MFAKGHEVETQHGRAVIVKRVNAARMQVRVIATGSVVEVLGSKITPLPVQVADKGWWLPAQSGKLAAGQTVMTHDGQIATITRLDGKAWCFTTAKPSNQQVYALRVFVADSAAYSAIDETAQTFDHFTPVKEDTIWRTHWVQWASQFQTTHTKAITNYCGSWYIELNAALRKGAPASSLKYCDRLDAALAMGKTERDMVVYRAGSSKFNTNMPAGSTFSDKGFGSCTINLQTAKNWTLGSNGTKALFVIRVPKGSTGGYVGSGIASQHTGEYEFILPRNCTFKVVKIEKPIGGQPRVTCDLIAQS